MTELEQAELRYERDLYKHRAYRAWMGLLLTPEEPKWKDYCPPGAYLDMQTGKWKMPD